MSGSPAPRGNPILVALMLTTGYVAVVIAVFGFTSLIADRDVLPAGTGPYLGPALVSAAAVVAFLGQRGLSSRASPVPAAAGAAALAYLAMIGVTLFAAPAVLAEVALGPFFPVAALLAGVLVATAWWFARTARRPPPPSTRADDDI